MKVFESLAVADADDLVFGTSPHPVEIRPGFIIGAGETLPELNYILPHGAEVSSATMDKVEQQYRDMAAGALERAVRLGIPRFVIEIEQVFEMTANPEWGERIARATREVIEAYESKGVTVGLRMTVADIRDRVRPPRNRTSGETDLVFESFERCAPYSDILSIESTGGKEVHDSALLMCDPGGVVFALGVLASNDMAFLWPRIVEIARNHGKVAGGDAACGFANTAMQLAHKRMIPTVFAAMVRAVGAARSLVAMEAGATGPDKDCAYEGPMLKAIAGIPIAMEGKSAACAHSSPVGNVAMSCCDLWSNESVPYVRLFGGYSPEVCLEQLWYDCKLMNESAQNGRARMLRDLLVASDVRTSAEALVLAPESVLRISRAILSSRDYLERALRAAMEAVAIIEEAASAGTLTVPESESGWLDQMKEGLAQLDARKADVVDYYSGMYPGFILSEYGL